MRSIRHGVIWGLVLSSGLLFANQSQAGEWTISDRRAQHETKHLDITGLLSPFGTFRMGVGVWYSMPVMSEGFIPSINDSFDIEFGGVLERDHWSSTTLALGMTNVDYSQTWYRASALGGVRWSFYLPRDWTVFATGKLGYGYGFGSSTKCAGTACTYASYPELSGLLVDFGAGTYWKINSDWCLRLDLGVFGAMVGVSIPM
jgi:hypothetical protein